MPTSFIITAAKIAPKGPASATRATVVELTKDGTGFALTKAGHKERDKVDKKVRVAKGWFDQLCKLGKGIGAAAAASGGSTDALVREGKDVGTDLGRCIQKELQDAPMWLYLVDEYTGEPVVPTKASSRYPIKTTTPSETAVKLLPVMRTGLKVMSVR